MTIEPEFLFRTAAVGPANSGEMDLGPTPRTADLLCMLAGVFSDTIHAVRYNEGGWYPHT